MECNSRHRHRRHRSSSSSPCMSPKQTKRKRAATPHVPAACIHCQRAHLACDVERPCRRCVQAGREDNCFEVQHKKRGRPRRRDRETWASSGAPSFGLLDGASRMLVPDMVHSSFSLTQPVHRTSKHGIQDSQMVTLLLSMDICCARVSDESLQVLGLYPHEFAHRSLYDFILPEHAGRLAHIHRCLLDNASGVCGEKQMPPTERTTAECFSSTPPALLLAIANGSQTLRETLQFRTSDGSFVSMQARFYLGGGLGSDLFDPETLQHLYIVCLATVDQPPSSATHPAPQPATDPLSALLAEMEHPLSLSFPEASDASSRSNSATEALLLHFEDGYALSPASAMSPSSSVSVPFLSTSPLLAHSEKGIMQGSSSPLLWLEPWMLATVTDGCDIQDTHS